MSCRQVVPLFFVQIKLFFFNKKESFVKANDVTHMAEMAMCHPNLEILWLIFTSPSSGTALCHFVFSAPAALCHFEAAKPDKPVGGRSRSPHRPESSVVNKCDEMIAPDSSMQLVSFFGETWQTFEANNVLFTLKYTGELFDDACQWFQVLIEIFSSITGRNRRKMMRLIALSFLVAHAAAMGSRGK